MAAAAACYRRAVATVGRTGDDAGRKKQRSAKKAESRLAGGVACTFVFGTFCVWRSVGDHRRLVLALSTGVRRPPTIEGLLALRRVRSTSASELPKAPDPEHEVLRIARAQGGRITASVVAVESSLSLAEAEEALDGMARRGHATIAVTDDGRVEYEFREFLPPSAPRPQAPR